MSPLLYSLLLTPLRHLFQFLVHWYWNGVKTIFHFFILTLESLDLVFAVRVTALNLASPLYQDYSLVGYAISIPTRLFLVIVGSLIYLVIFLFFLALIIIWYLIPILAILGSINPKAVNDLISVVLSYGLLFGI